MQIENVIYTEGSYIVNLHNSVIWDHFRGYPIKPIKVNAADLVTCEVIYRGESKEQIAPQGAIYVSENRSGMQGPLIHWLTYEIFRDYWN